MVRKHGRRIGAPLLKVVSLVLVAAGMSCAGTFAADAPPNAASGTTSDAAIDDGNYFKWGGYIRSWLSWNLQDKADSNNNTRASNTTVGGKGNLMMERASLSLNADAKTGPLVWRAVGRSDYEHITPYERRLEALAAKNGDGPGSHVLDQYKQTQLREFYVDAPLGDRVTLRLGKQQVVWGETDFFHPGDLLHGFDNRWRTFGEPESDELRKPLIMANLKISVPEAGGTLQLIVRPGLDRKQDIGNSYDIYGGRWMGQPNRGVDFLATATSFDYEHPNGNYKDTTGGIRWSALAGPINYAVSYLRVLYPDFTLNPCGAFTSTKPKGPDGCDPTIAYGKSPSNKVFGNWFYPKVDVFDVSVSGESTTLDAVLNFEVAYQKGRLFNSGTDFRNNAFTFNVFGVTNQPGTYGPVVKKNVIQTTFRADKQVRAMQSLLGTNAPGFFSVQVFDSWIQSYDRSDDIVASIGNAAPAKEHTTIATAFMVLPYMSSRLNPGLAYGRFLQSGDAFLIPSVSYNYGVNWRFSADAVLFITRNNRTDDRESGASSYPFTGFNQQNYFTLRATYQF